MVKKKCHVQAKKVQRRVQTGSRWPDPPTGRTAQVARDIGVGAGVLGRWRRKLETDKAKAFAGSGGPRDQEMATLRRELARVKKERDFLRDAAAFFARESS